MLSWPCVSVWVAETATAWWRGKTTGISTACRVPWCWLLLLLMLKLPSKFARRISTKCGVKAWSGSRMSRVIVGSRVGAPWLNNLLWALKYSWSRDCTVCPSSLGSYNYFSFKIHLLYLDLFIDWEFDPGCVVAPPGNWFWFGLEGLLVGALAGLAWPALLGPA